MWRALYGRLEAQRCQLERYNKNTTRGKRSGAISGKRLRIGGINPRVSARVSESRNATKCQSIAREASTAWKKSEARDVRETDFPTWFRAAVRSSREACGVQLMTLFPKRGFEAWTLHELVAATAISSWHRTTTDALAAQRYACDCQIAGDDSCRW